MSAIVFSIDYVVKNMLTLLITILSLLENGETHSLRSVKVKFMLRLFTSLHPHPLF